MLADEDEPAVGNCAAIGAREVMVAEHLAFRQGVVGNRAEADAELATLPDGRRVKWANETRNMPAQPARTIETRVMRLLKNKEV